MIGGYVVRGLMEKGHSVVGVDLRVNPNLNDNHNWLEQVVLDLGDKEAVERVFEKHQIDRCILKTSETVVCLEGCFDEIFYEELPSVDCGGPIHDGERALDERQFAEVARYRICPRDGQYGIQIPPMAWHTIEVHEPSTIFKAKDGAYGKLVNA